MRFLIPSAVFIGFMALNVATAGAQQTKTAAQCNADYAANKDAIKAAKIKKKDFVASCRAGNEAIPGAAAASPAAAAPPPVPAAPPPTTGFFGRKKAAPAPTQTAAPAAPPATTAPTGANEFQAAAQAQSRCPGALVVWVNTKSRIYHFPGTKNYGTTKDGAYMCEADATAAGDRASKTEKRP